MVIVQRVVMPDRESVSWTVLGDDGAPVAPVESYLAYLAALERSPNTQRAYATSLKLWFELLDRGGVARPEVGLDDVAGDTRRKPAAWISGSAKSPRSRRSGRAGKRWDPAVFK